MTVVWQQEMLSPVSLSPYKQARHTTAAAAASAAVMHLYSALYAVNAACLRYV